MAINRKQREYLRRYISRQIHRKPKITALQIYRRLASKGFSDAAVYLAVRRFRQDHPATAVGKKKRKRISEHRKHRIIKEVTSNPKVSSRPMAIKYNVSASSITRILRLHGFYYSRGIGYLYKFKKPKITYDLNNNCDYDYFNGHYYDEPIETHKTLKYDPRIPVSNAFCIQVLAVPSKPTKGFIKRLVLLAKTFYLYLVSLFRAP